MNSLEFKLKKLRKYKGLNQDELAQMLGVGKTTISNHETGYTKPPRATLDQLASFYGVKSDDLTNPNVTFDDLKACIEKKSPAPANTLGEEPTVSFTQKTVPVYLNLTTHTVPIHEFIFSTSFVGEGEIFGLKVSGDRMDRAALPDGSIAIIREQDYADDGEIIAVALEDNPAFFCRYFRQGEFVLLESESSNPVYRPVVVNPNEQSFKILGKVIKSLHSIF